MGSTGAINGYAELPVVFCRGLGILVSMFETASFLKNMMTDQRLLLPPHSQHIYYAESSEPRQPSPNGRDRRHLRR